MIFEGEFFSGGHLRWNLGWPTPNYAGAFLVTLLGLLWIFSSSRWRWAVLVVEAGGLFLLAKTYSRGAVVAWGTAWLFGVVASRAWRDPAERLVWAVRVVVLAVMMLVVGFGWSRAEGSGDQARGAVPGDGSAKGKAIQVEKVMSAARAEDGSVVNRLTLWRGGLKMIAAAPLTGWGAGESGRAYMNWYQDIERTEGYATMVNSYLHVAVEHGLLVLAAVLWIGAWLLLVAWKGTREVRRSESRERSRERGTRTIQQKGSMAAGASLVAWMMANVFTTLWIEPRLWVVPTIAAFVLVWCGWKNSSIRLVPLTVASLGITIVAASGLYGAGRWLLRGQSRAIIPGRNGSVMLASAGSTGAVWHAWPDPSVLGPTPGKELRRWFECRSANIRLVAHRAAPLQPGEVPVGATGLWLFGRQAERVGPDFPPACRELWLIHPTVPPPDESSKPSAEMITILLPQIDEAGNGPAWREWAEKNDARVLESPSCGLDIRAVWPAVLNAKKAPALAMKIP